MAARERRAQPHGHRKEIRGVQMRARRRAITKAYTEPLGLGKIGYVDNSGASATSLSRPPIVHRD